MTEGTDASYTLTATPKPAADLDVTVDVTQSGDFVTTGSQTVTITTDWHGHVHAAHNRRQHKRGRRFRHRDD